MQSEVTGKKIEEIKISRKEAELIFDDGDILTITIDTYSHFYLYKDKILSLSEINEITDYDDVSVLKSYALRLLSSKNYSEYQMKEKLIKKGSFKAVNKTISYLKEMEIINDRKYAEEKQDLMDKKNYGKKRILDELKEARVSENIISSLKFTDEGEKEKAQVQFEKYFRSNPSKSYEKRKQGAYNHLLLLGFDYETASGVCEGFSSEEEKDNDVLLLKKEMENYIRLHHSDTDDFNEKQKIIRHFVLKGFSLELIKNVLGGLKDE